MATLSVLKFNDPGGADRVLIALEGLQERQMITLEDVAAVVRWPAGDRSPRPTSYTARPALAPPGALSGASCSGLSSSYRSSARRSGPAWWANGIVGRRGDRRRFHQAGAEKVTPGTSALFALTSGATAPDRGDRRAQAVRLEIISTNLPEEQENQLREAFAHAVRVDERHRCRAVF